MSRLIARINYLNALPFFYGWSEDEPVLPGSPRGLAQKSAEIAAGPLPLVEGWRLQDDFEPFGSWGIAVQNESRSVFVLSQRPFSRLENIPLHVTPESSSSVALCRVLLKFKYGFEPDIRVGFSDDDEARLIIGDAAFLHWAGTAPSPWRFRTDLAQEWWAWQNLPFVFARWVIRKDADNDLRMWLADQIQTSLQASKINRPSLTHREAKRLEVDPDLVEAYLNGFTYNLGSLEEQAMHTFRTLYEQLDTEAPLVR